MTRMNARLEQQSRQLDNNNSRAGLQDAGFRIPRIPRILPIAQKPSTQR